MYNFVIQIRALAKSRPMHLLFNFFKISNKLHDSLHSDPDSVTNYAFNTFIPVVDKMPARAVVL